MESPSTFRPEGDVEVRAVDQGAVLVDMRSGSCFELNRAGYEVWLLIRDGKSEADICQALAEKYRRPFETIAADVRHVLRALTDHKLVRALPGPR